MIYRKTLIRRDLLTGRERNNGGQPDSQGQRRGLRSPIIC